MKYNFDKEIDRCGTKAYKLDLREKIFGNGDVIPLWVADMDFEAPKEVLDAIKERANHPIMGYSIRTSSFEESVARWLNKWHQWHVEPSSIIFAPGVVPSLVVSILSFTNPGDEVVIQTPIYPPFYSVVNDNERKLVKNTLINVNGRYEIDFDLLEKQFARPECKLFLFCNPHNPVGRAWNRDELLRLGALCLKYNIVVISDEIHADLVLFGNKHIPFASLSIELAQITVTCMAPSKTFNIAGLSTSFIQSENRQLLNELRKKINCLQIHMGNLFGNIACEVAYSNGEEWLTQLHSYIEDNINFVLEFFASKMPEVKIWKPEATYLMWIDFSAWKMTQNELKHFLTHEAGVGLNDGTSFGEDGVGFMRLNVATSRSVLVRALELVYKARIGK